LLTAQRHWLRAVVAVTPELEALEEKNSDNRYPSDLWRRQLMSRDRTGDLKQAWAAVQRAQTLARTPVDHYHVTVWLAKLACDRGHHQEELKYARRLIALQPRNHTSWGALMRAAECNGLERLAQAARAKVKALSR
jgi:hypothetical protein